MLSKRQKLVAQAVYAGKTPEQIKEQFKVSPGCLGRWLGREEFQQELATLCETSQQEMRRILSRWGPIAALRLAELVSSEKQEIARRAALDMIDRCVTARTAVPDTATEEIPSDMSDEQLAHLLRTFAEGLGAPKTSGESTKE